jgi:hypothetical protein
MNAGEASWMQTAAGLAWIATPESNGRNNTPGSSCGIDELTTASAVVCEIPA